MEAAFRVFLLRRHLLGQQTTDEVILAETQIRRIVPCGGAFNPCTHLLVGPLVRVARPAAGGANDRDLILDVGFPIDVSQSSRVPWYPPAPHIEVRDLKEGAWMAVLGEVGLALHCGCPELELTAEPVRSWVLDIRPASPTFGQTIEWEIGRKLPHDPDTYAYPSVFVEFALNLAG